MNRIQLLLLLRIEFVKIVTTIVRPGATAGTASELLVLLAGTAAHTGRQRDAATSSGRRINQLLLLLLLWQISVFRYASAAYRSTASSSGRIVHKIGGYLVRGNVVPPRTRSMTL